VRVAAGPLGRDGPRTTVLVRNPGPGPARLGTVTLTGPDAAQFRLDPSGCAGGTLPAAATCVVTGWLHPDHAGSLKASLVLTSIDIAAPLVVPVSGAVSKPVLRLTPAVARPGQVVLARGTGFPPGSTVELAWLSGLTAAHQPIVVRPDGTFISQVLILRKDQRGVRTLRATGPGYAAVEVKCLITRWILPPVLSGGGRP
jgi:hypothetical protein